MTAAAFPIVKAALVDIFTAALDPALVINGRDNSSVEGDVVMVGVERLDTFGAADNAGSFDQVMQTFGSPPARAETGRVNCLVVSRNGLSAEEGFDIAEAAAFAALDDLGAAIRATSGLGVTSLEYLLAELATGVVMERPVEGSAVALSFAVAYQARFV